MNLQEQLGKDDETLPERGELFLNLQVQQPRPTGNQNSFFDLRFGKARKRVGLQSRLAAKLHELRHKQVQKEAEADQGMLYTLEATSNEMCGDILFVRLTNRSNRMGRDFKTVVRKYLGLPVAKPGCSLGKCQDEPVHWNGAHGYHASTLVTYRHHGVKQAISGIVESLQNVGQFPYACQQERSMKDLGMERRPTVKKVNLGTKKKEKKKQEDRKIDIYFRHKGTGHAFYGDVRISELRYDKWLKKATSKSTLEHGVNVKYDLYTSEYVIDKNDVIPLVFDTYGGYADVTLKFLREIAGAVGDNDEVMVSKVMRRLRDRIAVELHKGQVSIINWINRNNPYEEPKARKTV
jgi:hypothetical protein